MSSFKSFREKLLEKGGFVPFKVEKITERSDRDALVYLFDVLHGAGGDGLLPWRKSFNWVGEERINKWFGIECEGGHVSTIDLIDNRLNGPLDIDLAYRLRPLINLQVLRISQNLVRGYINFISYFPNIVELNISWNQFHGVIPDVLYTLNKLEILRLDNNNLCGSVKSDIQYLVNLKLLDISNNKFSGIFPVEELKFFHNLYFINLVGNKFENEVPRDMGDVNKNNSVELNDKYIL